METFFEIAQFIITFGLVVVGIVACVLFVIPAMATTIGWIGIAWCLGVDAVRYIGRRYNEWKNS